MTDQEWLIEISRMVEVKMPHAITYFSDTPDLIGWSPIALFELPKAANENIHPLVRFNAAISEPGAML